jgi:hypothetical protein
MFETYRENFQEKYWLPTYTRSDDYFKNDQNDELPLRLIIHATGFKLNPPVSQPNPTAIPSSTGPTTQQDSSAPASSPPH